ncbi:MAG: TIGR02281 family clan AA aspartic protease [Idiomarina sp.]
MTQQDMPQRTGKLFAWLAWIIGLLFLYWLFDDMLQDQFNPNQNVQSSRNGDVIEVVLEQNRAGHYVATGTINNHRVLFLLDTGATQVAIPQEVAAAIGLPRGNQIIVNTANGRATAYRTQLDTLQLGDIVLRDVTATIVPGMGGEQILLGMSALKQVEFTQRGRMLTIGY